MRDKASQLAVFAFAFVTFTVATAFGANFDFEQAIVTPPGPAQVPIASGLPGWTGYVGANVLGTVNYNQEWLDSVGISVLDTNYTWRALGGFIHGRFCALIQSGLRLGQPSPYPPEEAAIAQSVTILNGVNTIQFSALGLTDERQLVVSFNGVPLSRAVLSNLPLPTSQLVGADISAFSGQTGELRFTRKVIQPVTGPASWGAVLLDNIVLSSAPLAAAPVILSDPWVQTGSTDVGATVDLLVHATAFPPPAYQWYFNNTNPIPNATNALLRLTNVQCSNSGNYFVIVRNIYGQVTSGPATLQVNNSYIVFQPASQTVGAGQTAQFSVTAGGPSQPAYFWKKGGLPLSDNSRVSGTLTPQLTIAPVLAADAGNYSVVISNSCRAITSQVATLTVTGSVTYPLPSVVTPPANETVAPGQSAVFVVTAQGAPPLWYQWQFNGVPLAGATTTELLLTNIQLNQAGAYDVTVANAYGSVTSAPAFLTVRGIPGFKVLHAFEDMDAYGSRGALLLLETNLYGVTRYGGTHGTVFRLAADGSSFSTLHHFYGTNGSDPTGSLVLGDTTFYGVTENGGSATDPGTVFTVGLDGAGFALLRSFNFSDGRWPRGGLTLAGGMLYGATGNGGSAAKGTLFKINTDGTGFVNLHEFAGAPTDGAVPNGNPVLSGDTLYGSTIGGGAYGGTSGWGTVYRIRTDGTGYLILKQFDSSEANCPFGRMVSSGTTLYGVTEGGFSGTSGAYSGGVVFKISTDGSGYGVLHRFAGPPNDGAAPQAGLTLVGETLFGTTKLGGSHGYSPPDYGNGTVFQLGTDGSDYQVLHDFTGDEGRWPLGELTLANGKLYGTTSGGGTNFYGTIFALDLPVPRILTPPVSCTAEAGSSAVLRVRAEFDPSLTYQWFFNGTNALGGPSTNRILQLNAVQAGQSGTYTVVLSNLYGAETSPPVSLSAIPAVERRQLPAVTLYASPGSRLNVEAADGFETASGWFGLDSVSLSNFPTWWFDTSTPLPPQRFYRVRSENSGRPAPLLGLGIAPALVLAGTPGARVQVDYINQSGPIDAWTTLGTVTLTNSVQLFPDTSAINQPPRLWRITAVSGP